MRFMTIVKGPEDVAPTPELFAAMDELIAEGAKSGVFGDMGGLKASKEGARAKIRGGKISITDGPFTESKEVIGGFAIMNCANLAEAKEWTRKFLQLHVEHLPGWDGEVEIRPMEDPPAA